MQSWSLKLLSFRRTCTSALSEVIFLPQPYARLQLPMAKAFGPSPWICHSCTPKSACSLQVVSASSKGAKKSSNFSLQLKSWPKNRKMMLFKKSYHHTGTKLLTLTKVISRKSDHLVKEKMTTSSGVNLSNVGTKSYLEKLEVVMPGRWCNLFLESGKGHVAIQNMKEANVNVTTNGGNVTFGEMRGNEAFINSNGGSVRAALITAALQLKTDGGVLSLGKAIGTYMQIDTCGGDMVIGSAYGQDAKFTSGGGCVAIQHLQSQELAHVSSNGGHVQIDGLDGNAEILTGGGDVELQLLANAREVKIDAGAGKVTLFMPSEMDVKVEKAENWECLAKSFPSGSMQKSSSGCRVFVSGSGPVTTLKRSWLEAVMQAQSASLKAG